MYGTGCVPLQGHCLLQGHGHQFCRQPPISHRGCLVAANEPGPYCRGPRATACDLVPNRRLHKTACRRNGARASLNFLFSRRPCAGIVFLPGDRGPGPGCHLTSPTPLGGSTPSDPPGGPSISAPAASFTLPPWTRCPRQPPLSSSTCRLSQPAADPVLPPRPTVQRQPRPRQLSSYLSLHRRFAVAPAFLSKASCGGNSGRLRTRSRALWRSGYAIPL